MASYIDAVNWIAGNEATADTPEGMDFGDACEHISGYMTIVLVADVWKKTPAQVAVDVLKARGFDMPRGFLSRRDAFGRAVEVTA